MEQTFEIQNKYFKYRMSIQHTVKPRKEEPTFQRISLPLVLN